MNKKAAIFIAEGFEESEAIVPLDILRRAGVVVDLVSIREDLSVTSTHGLSIKCEKSISQINFDDYDVLILPGGMPGTLNLEKCERLCEALGKFKHTQGKYLAAICAAPSILAHLDLLQGVRATAYGDFKEDLAQGGAIVVEDASVVVDKNIITAQGMGCALEFGYALVSELVDKDIVPKMKYEIKDFR